MSRKKGTTDRIHKKWEKICIDFVSAKHLSHTRFKQICRTMIRDFDHIPITDEKKPRVGIVGEILVKFFRRRITIWRSCSKVKVRSRLCRI